MHVVGRAGIRRPELALAQYLRPTTPPGGGGGPLEEGRTPPGHGQSPRTPSLGKRVGGGNGEALWPKEPLGLEIGNPEINQENVFLLLKKSGLKEALRKHEKHVTSKETINGSKCGTYKKRVTRHETTPTG